MLKSMVTQKKKKKSRGKGYCLALSLVALTGCAEALPLVRTGNALQGLRSFYLAVCAPPPAGKEKVCSEGRDVANQLIDVYTQINEAVGE